jgi:hypothetical protein
MSLNQFINPIKPLDIVVNTINGEPVETTALLYGGLSSWVSLSGTFAPSLLYRAPFISVENVKTTYNGNEYNSYKVVGSGNFINVAPIISNTTIQVKTSGLLLPTTLNETLNVSSVALRVVGGWNSEAYVTQVLSFGDSDITFDINISAPMAINDVVSLNFEVLLINDTPI